MFHIMAILTQTNTSTDNIENKLVDTTENKLADNKAENLGDNLTDSLAAYYKEAGIAPEV